MQRSYIKGALAVADVSVCRSNLNLVVLALAVVRWMDVRESKVVVPLGRQGSAVDGT